MTTIHLVARGHSLDEIATLRKERWVKREVNEAQENSFTPLSSAGIQNQPEHEAY